MRNSEKSRNYSEISHLQRILTCTERKARFTCTIDDIHQYYLVLVANENDPTNGLIVKYHQTNNRHIRNCLITGTISQEIIIENVHFYDADFSHIETTAEGKLIFKDCTFDEKCRGQANSHESAQPSNKHTALNQSNLSLYSFLNRSHASSQLSISQVDAIIPLPTFSPLSENATPDADTLSVLERGSMQLPTFTPLFTSQMASSASVDSLSNSARMEALQRSTLMAPPPSPASASEEWNTPSHSRLSVLTLN